MTAQANAVITSQDNYPQSPCLRSGARCFRGSDGNRPAAIILGRFRLSARFRTSKRRPAVVMRENWLLATDIATVLLLVRDVRRYALEALATYSCWWFIQAT
jgi:hypothetical protein